MSHTPNPIYEDKSGRTTFSLVFTILVTGGVFLIIPLTQLSSQERVSEESNENKTRIISPPPKPPEPPEPPEPDNQTDEPPEIEDTFQPVPLYQITGLFLPNGNGANQFIPGFNSDDFPIENIIYLPSELDVAPKPILSASPNYPPELKRAGVEGSVEVIYVVTPKGNVTNIRITDATHREFAESVRGALRRWSFEPGKKDNQDVSTRVRQSFGFNLQ